MNSNEQVHISDYLDAVLRHKSLIVLFFVFTVLSVWFFTVKMTPVYRATVTMLIDMESPKVLTTTGVVALEKQDYYSYKEYYQSQKEILTSLSIMKRVFEEYDIGGAEEYKKSKEPLKKFIKTVRIEPIRDTRLIRLHVENKDPALAQKVANRIAEIYVRRNLFYIGRDELTNLLKNEYLKLEAKLAEYVRIYKDKHPKMIRLKEEMAGMSRKIEEVKKISTDSDYMNEDLLSGEFDYLLHGFKANNVSVQDPAELPAVPVRPKKLLNMILAVITGILGGIILALFFEYADDTIKDVDALERIVNKPFLGGVLDAGRMRERDRDRIVHVRPKDPVAESYRTIRTNVFFSHTEECPLRTLVLTSPGPQEGKTMTLCNLGIAMAQNSKKVLLVDADIRKPRLHHVFGADNKEGLSNYLSGNSGFDVLIKNTEIHQLSVVTGGYNAPNPSELISSKKMDEFIKIVKGKFDIILFDTPPVAIVTDAVVLAQKTDGVIVVVESGSTSKRVLPRIIRNLEDAKIKITGLILNRLRVTAGSPYRYYYSKYYGK